MLFSLFLLVTTIAEKVPNWSSPGDFDCCSSITISGFPTDQQANRDGLFTLVGIAQDDHPVYQNDDGQYLYYWGEYQDWRIGPDYTSPSAGVISSDNKRGCPDTFSSWSLYYDGSWNEVQSVSVECATPIFEMVATELSSSYYVHSWSSNPRAYPGGDWTNCGDWDHDENPPIPADGYWYSKAKSRVHYDGRMSEYASANCNPDSDRGGRDDCLTPSDTSTYYSCAYQYGPDLSRSRGAFSLSYDLCGDPICWDCMLDSNLGNKDTRCCYHRGNGVEFSKWPSSTWLGLVGGDCDADMDGGVRLYQAMLPDRCLTQDDTTECFRDGTQLRSTCTQLTGYGSPATFFYRDSDTCLQSSPEWGNTWTCASAAEDGHCGGWAKDMHRCCPVSCGTGVLTPWACLRLTGSGTCKYTYYENGYDTGGQKCGIRVNCAGYWGQWGEWSGPQCGGNTQTRSRDYEIDLEPEFGGDACPESPQDETRVTDPCQPVDCEFRWNDWGDWSEPQCGGNTQTRSRTISISTQPEHGGDACPSSPESETQVTSPCPDSEYRQIASGHCEDYGFSVITTLDSCQAAARMLGYTWKLSGIADNEYGNERPQGCAHHSGGNLFVYPKATGPVETYGHVRVFCTDPVTLSPTSNPSKHPSRAPTADPTLFPTKNPSRSPTLEPTGASSHGDPIIHTFKGECFDLNKDGLYLASSHPYWNHEIKVAVYNNFIREFQITTKDDQILFSVNNLNEVTGSWAYGLKHIYRMCTPFSWKECEFSFNEYRFDAQIFMYGVQILFHDYLDPALQKGQRGVHLDIYPRLYDKHQQTFNAEDWDGIYFDNPLPQELAYCPGNSPRRS